MDYFFGQSYYEMSKNDPALVNITSVDFSHFNSSLLESIEGMFYRCSSLEEINFTNFNTSNVNNMNYLFYECSNLKSLDLSNFNTSKITKMNLMFEKCSSLKSLDLSNFNTSKVIKTNGMFKYCTSLEFLDISNFDMRNIIEDLGAIEVDEEMFNNMDKIKYLNLDNIQYNDYFKRYTSNKFKGREGLTVCQKTEIIENVKNECYTSNYIIVKYKAQTKYENGFQNEYKKDIKYIINGDLILGPNDALTIDANTEIEIHFSEPIKTLDKFFYDSGSFNIISVDLSHFDSSLLESFEWMFGGCSSLEEINFSNFNTSKINSFQGIFSGCSQLKSLDLTNFDTSKASSSMGSMFKGCSKLTSLDLSNFDTSKVTNMSEMFSGCSSLQILDLNRFITNEVTDMNKIFSGCDNLKYLDISQFKILSNDIFNDLNKLEFINIYKTQNFDFNAINNNNLKICQKEKKIKNIENKCGYYNIENKIDSTNLIIIYFDKNIEYESGFINTVKE